MSTNVVTFYEKSPELSAKLYIVPSKDLAKFKPFLCKHFMAQAI
jgi:hypothetical protein